MNELETGIEFERPERPGALASRLARRLIDQRLPTHVRTQGDKLPFLVSAMEIKVERPVREECSEKFRQFHLKMQSFEESSDPTRYRIEITSGGHGVERGVLFASPNGSYWFADRDDWDDLYKYERAGPEENSLVEIGPGKRLARFTELLELALSNPKST